MYARACVVCLVACVGCWGADGKRQDHAFIAEETAAHGELTDAPTWLVDPLDGTTNFVHDYPFVCVSIGLAVARELVVGVVYNPIMDQMYTAVKGGGAFLNNLPIRVSGQTELGAALVCTNIGASRDPGFIAAVGGNMQRLLSAKLGGLRMSGSAAMNMAHVAAGKLDAYYEVGIGGPWDMAAGAVLVREAGGVLADPRGGEFGLFSRCIICGTPAISEKVLQHLSWDGVRL